MIQTVVGNFPKVGEGAHGTQVIGAINRWQRQDALGRAITIARREGDVPLEVRTLNYAADVSGRHLHCQESVDNGLRAIELAAGDDTFSEMNSRFWTVLGFLRLGDLDAARPHALVLRDVAALPVMGVLILSGSSKMAPTFLRGLSEP